MHNTKDLRKNLDKFKKKFLDRNFKFDIKLFEKLDNTNRELISKKEKLEQEKKKSSKSNDKTNYAKSKKISEEISDLIHDKKYKKIYLLDKKRKNIIKSLHTNLKDKNVLNCLKNIKVKNDNMISMLNKNKKSAYNDHVINIKRLNAYKKI